MASAIRLQREKVGLSLEDLAEQLELDVRQVRRIEDGSVGVTKALLGDIAAILKTSAAALQPQVPAEEPAGDQDETLRSLPTQDAPPDTPIGPKVQERASGRRSPTRRDPDGGTALIRVDSEVLELIVTFQKLTQPGMRRAAMAVVRALASDQALPAK